MNHVLCSMEHAVAMAAFKGPISRNSSFTNDVLLMADRIDPEGRMHLVAGRPRRVHDHVGEAWFVRESWLPMIKAFSVRQ